MINMIVVVNKTVSMQSNKEHVVAVPSRIITLVSFQVFHYTHSLLITHLLLFN